MKDLSRKSVSAVKWATMSTVARFVLQLIAQVILARILGPEVYGLFGMGLVVYAFCLFMANIGLGWTLMQRPTLTDEDIRFAVTWQTIVGLAGTTVLVASAPLIAGYFGEPQVADVVRGLSLACVLSAAASPAGNLMQREMRFRETSIIQVLSYAVGYLLIGVPLAVTTHSVHALVAAWVSQALVVLIGNYLAVRHPIKPLLWYAGARSMFSRGGQVFTTNICNWWLSNLDRLIVGRLLDAHAMGVYTVGYNLANLPNSLLIGALQPAFLSSGARVQDDTGRLRNAYAQIVSSILVLLLPAFTLLGMLSEHIIGLLYGEKWTGSVQVARILFFAMPAYIAWGLSTPVLWNTGRGHLESLLQLPLIAVALIGFKLWGGQGVMQAGTVAATLLLLRGLVMITAACRATALNAAVFLPALWRSLLLSSAMAGGCILGEALISQLTVNITGFWRHSTNLLAGTGAALVLVIPMVVAKPQLLGDHASRLIRRFIPKRVHP